MKWWWELAVKKNTTDDSVFAMVSTRICFVEMLSKINKIDKINLKTFNLRVFLGSNKKVTFFIKGNEYHLSIEPHLVTAKW